MPALNRPTEKMAGYAFRVAADGILKDPVVFLRELSEEELASITEQCILAYGWGELIRLNEEQTFRLWQIGKGMDAMKEEVERPIFN